MVVSHLQSRETALSSQQPVNLSHNLSPLACHAKLQSLWSPRLSLRQGTRSCHLQGSAMRPTFTVPLWGFTGVEENDRGSTDHGYLGKPPCLWPGLPHSGVGTVRYNGMQGSAQRQLRAPEHSAHARGESTAHTMGGWSRGGRCKGCMPAALELSCVQTRFPTASPVSPSPCQPLTTLLPWAAHS